MRCSERDWQSSEMAKTSPLIGGSVWPTLQRPVPHGLTRLLIVRHGETKWNAEKRMQGQLDIELNDAGRHQARRARDAVGENRAIAKAIDAVVSSDLHRASETADIISASCPQAQRSLDPRLREGDVGQFQGMLAAEVKDVYRSVQAEWNRGELQMPVPGGECPKDVIVRGHSAIQDAAKLGSLVVVVAHGGLIRWNIAAIEFDEHATVQESMASHRVRSVLASHVGNCACCVVLFDHANKTFCGEHYFATLADGDTLDDTG